jgi:hypothetical protein
MKQTHTFHIPVMGIAFTVDTPVKVAHLGLDSVIFICDDVLLEKLRKMYSFKFNLPYLEITSKAIDSRAKRITSYLNLIKKIAEKNLDELIKSSSQVKKYFDLLPNTASIKQQFTAFTNKVTDTSEIKKWLKQHLSIGDINVNIMTKLDKENFVKNKKLPVEFNDAHAALRGFANSNLESSMVFSAGMNPRLFSYIEQFDDFFPNKDGYIKKKIILKVSDYRSALIQGKFLAKKGIWVSEYRIESGLNCGGHAFATDGFLMGPILEEFKNNKASLISDVTELLNKALANSDRVVPNRNLDLKITAQGGVGTAEEQDFLLNYFNLDSVGWGTPFLLVPEVTNVDDSTLKQLKAAKESDLYLSDSSPLGVPFNNIRNSSKYLEKEFNIEKGKLGNACTKKFLALHSDDDGKTICTASRKYQEAKYKELQTQKAILTDEQFEKEFKAITAKECLCNGLSTSVMHLNNIDRKLEKEGVSICPGPNLAYYSKISTLQDMTNHIYGKSNVLQREDRPHIFIKELSLYMDFLRNKLNATLSSMDKKQIRYFNKFIQNMENGIAYYKHLFTEMNIAKPSILFELNNKATQLSLMKVEVENCG